MRFRISCLHYTHVLIKTNATVDFAVAMHLAMQTPTKDSISLARPTSC